MTDCQSIIINQSISAPAAPPVTILISDFKYRAHTIYSYNHMLYIVTKINIMLHHPSNATPRWCKMKPFVCISSIVGRGSLAGSDPFTKAHARLN